MDDIVRTVTPTHPGELLREEVLPNMGHNVDTFAGFLEVETEVLQDLVNEKTPMTEDMAHRLSKFLDTTPDLWMNMQKSYDEHMAQTKSK